MHGHGCLIIASLNTVHRFRLHTNEYGFRSERNQNVTIFLLGTVIEQFKDDQSVHE